MAEAPFRALGTLRGPEAFAARIQEMNLEIPFDPVPDPSVLARPLILDGVTLGNRLAIHPMEGWDGTPDGRPTERVFRRWRRFGQSGAALIWGGEAFSVRSNARANPHQLCLGPHSAEDLGRLREALGSGPGLLTGLQLTHSGRFSHAKPLIAHRHPVLDRRLGLGPDHPLVTDGEIRGIVADFVKAAVLAKGAGFDFVDLKHCHGYLAHELLAAHTREGDYGGPFEHRTRFLRELVQGVRAAAPGLGIGVRLSAFDTVPFRKDPDTGVGVPEDCPVPYRWGFGTEGLQEAAQFLQLCRELGIRLVSLTAGSPYTNPHIQRPAIQPPSDGYRPPEDPLVGVARQIAAVRDLKRQFPDLCLLGAGYSYLQEFLPGVAQAVVRHGWADCVGLGRMVLSYPEMPRDILAGAPLDARRICRTFSDCTTAPRQGLPSGCYPLDSFYKESPEARQLKEAKRAHR